MQPFTKPVKSLIQSWSTVGRITPDPPKEREIEVLGAALGLLVLSTVPDAPRQGTPGASPPWQREHDHRIGPGKPDVERASVIAVNDPTVAREQTDLDVHPLLPRRGDPVWFPKMLIEVDDGDACSTPQFVGERRLPGPSRPDDHDALHLLKSG